MQNTFLFFASSAIVDVMYTHSSGCDMYQVIIPFQHLLPKIITAELPTVSMSSFRLELLILVNYKKH